MGERGLRAGRPRRIRADARIVATLNYRRLKEAQRIGASASPPHRGRRRNRCDQRPRAPAREALRTAAACIPRERSERSQPLAPTPADCPRSPDGRPLPRPQTTHPCAYRPPMGERTRAVCGCMRAYYGMQSCDKSAYATSSDRTPAHVTGRRLSAYAHACCVHCLEERAAAGAKCCGACTITGPLRRDCCRGSTRTAAYLQAKTPQGRGGQSQRCKSPAPPGRCAPAPAALLSREVSLDAPRSGHSVLSP